MVVRCTGACIGLAHCYRPQLVLAPVIHVSLLRVVYRNYTHMRR
jgi:hypothetical protein